MRRTGYKGVGDQHLVRFPKHRAIRVILIGIAFGRGATRMAYLEEIGAQDKLIQKAALVAKKKGWKTIIVEPDPISGERAYGCNIAGHLAAGGFNRNEVFLGYIRP